jgi:hypothetical protein
MHSSPVYAVVPVCRIGSLLVQDMHVGVAIPAFRGVRSADANSSMQVAEHRCKLSRHATRIRTSTPRKAAGVLTTTQSTQQVWQLHPQQQGRQ